MPQSQIPDFLFIDTVILAYRLGQVRVEEQKQALLQAARVADDAISFMNAVEGYGVGPRTRLHQAVGQILASHAYYCIKYARMLGIRKEGNEAEAFLNNNYVLFLVEPLLLRRQQQEFFKTYWWFVHNHRPVFMDAKTGRHIGVYATEPQDNASTLQRFEAYMSALVNHKNKQVRQRFEGFPIDIVLAVLKRAFL